MDACGLSTDSFVEREEDVDRRGPWAGGEFLNEVEGFCDHSHKYNKKLPTNTLLTVLFASSSAARSSARVGGAWGASCFALADLSGRKQRGRKEDKKIKRGGRTHGRRTLLLSWFC